MADEETTETVAEEAASQQEAPQQQFSLQRIYIKDLSFESPGAPELFKSEWKPAMNVDLNTKSTQLGDSDYEVLLTITVTAKAEEQTAYLIEVQQAGIFRIVGVEGENLRRVLATACPTMLFPYARETIDCVVGKGSYPPLLLSPVNFDALFAQAVQQSQQEAQSAAEQPTQ